MSSLQYVTVIGNLVSSWILLPIHLLLNSQDAASGQVRVIGWVRRTDFANIRQESDKVGSFWALAESTLIR